MWSPIPWAMGTGGFLKEVVPGGAGRGWEKGACIWERAWSVGWKQPDWGGGLLTAQRPFPPHTAVPQATEQGTLGSAVHVTASAGGWWLLWGVRMGRRVGGPLEGTGRGLSRSEALGTGSWGGFGGHEVSMGLGDNLEEFSCS